MIKLFHKVSLFLIIILLGGKVYAQFPYDESFRNAIAPGINFGGVPTSFLTAAGGGPNGTAIDPPGAGYLRLTSNTTNQKGFVYNDASFPSFNGLKINVEYFVYDGDGADGISFFLFDANATPFVVGGFGGSLGYAPIQINPLTDTISPGVSKGYLAIGLDEYGNFSNPIEGRQGGIPGLRPNSVTLRGKGDGSALISSNYPFLTTVRTSDLGFDLTTPGLSVRVPDSTDSRYRRVSVDLKPSSLPGGGYEVSVRIITGGPIPVVHNVITNYHYAQPAPSLLKYGIASSTGASRNFHEIRNVSIKVFNPAGLVPATANPDATTSCLKNTTSLDVVTNDATPNTGGSIDISTLDLNPSLEGVQKTFTRANVGTWTANAAGIVTFVPSVTTLTGSVVIPYTIKDNYGQVSLPGTITINDAPAPPSGTNAGVDQLLNISSTTTTATLAATLGTAPVQVGTWTQVSGPSTVTFSDISSKTSTVSGLTYGSYTFRWSVTEGVSCQGTDDVVIFVNAIPVAVDDNPITSVNTDISIPVLANDTDANGNNTINRTTVSIPPGSNAVHGTTTVDPVSGVIIYRPTPGYIGSDSFVYTVRDNFSALSNFAIVTITVSPKPVGVDDVLLTVINVPNSLNVKTNDITQSGTTVVKLTDPTHGTITVNSSGPVNYVPATDYHGFDSFTYNLRNGDGILSNPITVAITVRPGGTNDASTTLVNTPVSISVKDNDAGKTGSTPVKRTDPLHGTVLVNADGTITYTPAADYSGNDSFTYILHDLDGLDSDPITVTVVVKPVGTNDASTTNINTAVIIPVKDNDVSRVGTTVIKKTDPTNGTAFVNTDGTVTYTPISNFTGTDTFTYALRTADAVESNLITVTVTVRAKLAGSADLDFTRVNVAKTITVKTNDANGAGNSVVKVTNPLHGTATLNADDTFLFTPTTDYYGYDSFTYKLTSSNGSESDPITVTVGIRPIGTNDSYSTSMNTLVTQSVKDNDLSKTGTTVVQQTAPLHGTNVINSNSSVTYTPVSGYVGLDTYTYILRNTDLLESDAITVTVSIKPVGTDDASITPLNTLVVIPVKTNDLGATGTTVVKKTDPARGTAFVNSDGTVSYTPLANYHGRDLFTYALRTIDGIESDPITVTLSIRPAGTNDEASTNPNIPVTIAVKDNDISNTAVTVLKQTNPTNGSVVVNPDGTITYTPSPGFLGADTFTYILRNSDGIESNPITVTVNIQTKPAGSADGVITRINTPVTINVRVNDVSGPGSTVIKLTDPIHGTAVLNTDGTFLYTPVTDYYGQDTYTYKLRTAGGSESDPITVTIGVRPAGTNDTYTTEVNTAIVQPVKDNDFSKTGTTVVMQTNPLHGTPVVNLNGTITFTPVIDYVGVDIFSYILRNTDGLESDPIIVTVSIKPSGTNDVSTTPLNTLVVIPVKNNDLSKTGTTVVKKTDPAHGTISVNPDGSVNYTPTTDYIGKDTFTYTLRTSDGVESDPITVAISIRPVGSDDNATTNPATTVIIAVKENDISKTGTTVVKKSNPASGTATVNADNTITYLPGSGFQGTDTFTYALLTSDGVESNIINVTVVVRAKPSGLPDAAATKVNVPVTITVTTNDPGAPGSTVIKLTEPTRGTATLNPDGTFLYTPAVDYHGPDSYTYILRSAAGVDSDPITVSISVRPSGSNDVYTTAMNTALIQSVKDNDLSKTGTSVIRQTNPLHGTATVNIDGTITYTPTSGYMGTDSYIYTLRNTDLIDSDPITVSISIKPVGTDDVSTTALNTVVAIPVKDNDLGRTGTVVVKKTDPLHGTVTVNVDGTVSYTPATDYNGKDTFTYTLRTTDGVESDPITVVISIRPSGTDDAVTTAPATPVVIAVKTNDVSKTGTTVVRKTNPANGTANVNSDATVTYTPATGFTGTDSFTYTLLTTDGVESNPITVTIAVVAPSKPLGLPDAAATKVNVPVTITVTTNDPGAPGSTVIKLTEPTRGTATLNPDGTFLYTPAVDYHGPDSYTYILRSAAGVDSDPITVSISVRPSGSNDVYTTAMNTALIQSVKDNDLSKTGTSVIRQTNPLHGTATVNIDGTITYTPTSGYMGTDSYIYTLRNTDLIDSDPITVSISIKPVGTDDVSTTALNTVVAIPVKDNDLGRTGTTVVKKTDPLHGTVTVNVDGTVSYTPATDYNGKDTFTYTLRTTDGVESDPITVVISIRPSGTDDAVTTAPATPVVIAVKTNDVSKTGTTVVKKTNPANGTANVNSDATVTYTPATGFTGTDSFTYTLLTTDGVESNPITVTIAVVAPLKPLGLPDAAVTKVNVPVTITVTTNDPGAPGSTVVKLSNPTRGIATLNTDGTFLYTPNIDYHGPDSYNYILRSSAGIDSDPITVSISVRPAGSDDVYTTPMNTALIQSVKDNDLSKTGTSVIKLTNPARGTAVVNSDGTITFTPISGSMGTDLYTYLLRNTDLIDSDPITVSINIKPVGTDDASTTSLNTVVSIPVKDNDLGRTGTTVVKKTDPLRGTAVVNVDGTVSYIPAIDYNGKDTFTYTLRTSDGVESDPITVVVSIRPSGTDDAVTTPPATPVAITVKTNDVSKTGTTVVKKTNPSNGTAVVNSDATATYTPTTGFTGTDSFTYTLLTTDGVESNTITVTILVATPPKPTGLPDVATTIPNTPVTITVRTNDPGAPGSTVIKLTNPLRGTATLNPDGTFLYTPNTDYYGPDSFAYILRNPAGVDSDPITVTIGVRPQGTNDTYSVAMNTAQVQSVKDNDLSKTGTTVVKLTNPANGTAVVNTDGTVNYTPVTGYLGPDVYTYLLRNADGLESDPITVTLNIKPAGATDLSSTLMNTPVTISVKDNDPSKAGTTVVKKTDPLRGTIVINPDGTVTYTPPTDYSGPDSFTYALLTPGGVESDPITVTVSVKPRGIDDVAVTSVNVPVIVRIKDNDPGKVGTTVIKKTDPLHGTVVINPDGTVTYTPVPNYRGPDTFTYTLRSNDGVESDPITVSLETRNQPVANPDPVPVPTGIPVIIKVTDNDTGQDCAVVKSSVVITVQPLHGTIALVNGEVTYTPFPGYSGLDNFSYTVKDCKGLESKPGIVTITVTTPKIGIAKKLLDVKPVINGTFDVRYLFTIINYSPFSLKNLSLKDDLLSVFNGATVTVVKVSHQGTLRLNPSFNGSSNIEMLIPANSTIGALGEEQVELTVNIRLVSREGVFENSALVEAYNDQGVKVTDQSTDGLRPDPTTTGDVSPSVNTPVELKVNPIFIPEGFSPNNDGINDYFVIQNTLDKPVHLEIFNRWGNVLFKSAAYQNDWNGKTNRGIHFGDDVPAGTYWYIIDIDGQKYTGSITVNR